MTSEKQVSKPYKAVNSPLKTPAPSDSTSTSPPLPARSNISLLSMFSLGFLNPYKPKKKSKYSRTFNFPTDLLFIFIYVYSLYYYWTVHELKFEFLSVQEIIGIKAPNNDVCGVGKNKDKPFLIFKDGKLSQNNRFCTNSCENIKEGEFHVQDWTDENYKIKYKKFLIFCIPEDDILDEGEQKILGLNYKLNTILVIYDNLRDFLYSSGLNVLLTLCCSFLMLLLSNILIVVFALLILVVLVIFSYFCIAQPDISEFLKNINNTNAQGVLNTGKSVIKKIPSGTLKKIGYATVFFTFIFFVLFMILFQHIRSSAKIIRKTLKGFRIFPGHLIVALFVFMLKMLLLYLSLLIFLQLEGKKTNTRFHENDEMLQNTNQEVTIKNIKNTFEKNIAQKMGENSDTNDAGFENGIFDDILLFIWNLLILDYFLYAVVVGSSTEYFLDSDNNNSTILFGIITSFFWVFKVLTQIGTIIFAALIVSIISTIEILVKQVMKQLSSKETVIEKILYYSVGMFVWIVKIIVEYLSKNGLIYSITFNTDLLTGMIQGNSIMLKNIGGLIVPSIIKNLVLSLLKLGVPALSVILSRVLGFTNSIDKALLTNYELALFIYNYILTSTLMIIIEGYVDSSFFCYVLNKEYDLEGAKDISELLE